MKALKFQYYPAKIKANKPIGVVGLDYFIKAHKNPKPEMVGIFEAIAAAEAEGDLKKKAELKQNNLYFFTPCVLVHPYRRYSDIKQFTGLSVLDFDHIDNAAELKEYLFNEYKFIVAAWLSPSKKGVKALVKIPVADSIDKFKAHYFALQNEFEVFDGYDPSTKNAVLPLFQSYDYDLLYRDDYKTFTKTALDPNLKRYDEVRNHIPTSEDRQYQRVLKIAESSISQIGAPGHYQLRSACIALGGYIATGYVSDSEMMALVYTLIENNAYLRKGLAGYKKTARWSIDEGKRKPITL